MRSLLDPAQIIGFAHGAKPANWGKTMPADYDDLVSRLMALLESRQTPFVIVGGIALLQHVPGRNTEDIDIILSTTQLHQLPELIVQERNDLFALCQFGGLRVDVLLTEHALFQLVVDKFSAPMAYQTGQHLTATIEGLILLKLFALPSLYRQFDFDRMAIYETDITQLLSRTEHSDEFFLSLLAPHLPASDQSEVAGVLRDIRGRVDRMKKRGA